MTSLMGAKKRAEEFAAAVDGRQAPTNLRPELLELADVVRALRATADPAPRSEFTASLRERLMAEAATSLTPSSPLALPSRPKGTRERRLAVAASAFVLVGGTAGMAAAAQNALPGDALYPIKRGLEKAQADLSPSASGKGHNLLNQAGGRLAEAASLMGSNDAQANVAIAEFTAQAQQGAALLLESFAKDRDPEKILDVRQFAADAIGTLQELAKTAPAGSQDDLANAALALQQIDRSAEAACGSCADSLPALQIPPLFLTAGEAAAALDRAAGSKLSNAHPALSGKPATGKAAKSKPGSPESALPSAPAAPSVPLSGPSAPAPVEDPASGLTGLPSTLDDLLDGGSSELLGDDLLP